MQAVPCNSCGQQVPALATPQGWGQQPGLGSFGAAPGMHAQPAPGMHAQPPVQPNWVPPPPVGGPAAHPAPKAHMQLPYGVKLPIAVGGGMKLKIIGGVVLAIVLAVGGVILKSKFTTPKGMLSYSSLGLAKGKPDADAMYAAVARPAGKWKRDAIFWSLNYQAVRADGTVDVAKGAEVVFVSPSAAASHAKSVRSDSMKKYGFTASGVKHKDRWGFTKPAQGIEALPEPKCKVKDVVALLATQGLTGNKTVRVTFDPKFADFLAWRVIGQDPKIDAHYSWEDCTLIQ